MTGPWSIADRTGDAAVCGSSAEWLAEWRHRIQAIEASDRPVHLRREGLDRMLAANATSFRALVNHGVVDAVIEVTAAAAAADGRLSKINENEELAA